MPNFSKFLSLIDAADKTVDLSNSANVLELGGGLQMDGSTSGYVVINASATTTSYNLVWPTSQAASSGYVLTNDGAGNLSWGSALTNLTGVVTSVGNVTSIPNGNITNAMLATSYNVNLFTLASGDISNGYVTLSTIPNIASDTILTVIGGPMQSYGSDYTVSGAVLTWIGNLATIIAAGDKLVVQYN